MQVLFFLLVGLAGQFVPQTEYDPEKHGELIPIISDKDENLRNRGPFKVLVGGLDADAPVTETQIRTDVELRLRSLGIPLSSDDVPVPFLSVLVSTLSIKPGEVLKGYSFAVIVSYRDVVLVNNDKQLACVALWETSGIGTTDSNRAAQYIRENVQNYVDIFANAWLKTHPKEPAAEKKPATKEMSAEEWLKKLGDKPEAPKKKPKDPWLEAALESGKDQ